MMDTIRAEWIKLRTSRVVWLLPLLAIVFAVIGALQKASIIQDPFYTDGGPVETVALVQFASQLRVVIPTILMLLGVVSVTGEYSSGLIRTTALAEPTRWRIVIAKILVNGAVAVVATVAALAVAMFVGWTQLTGEVSAMPLTDGSYGWRIPLLALIDTLLLVAVGVGLALVLKRAAAVIVVLVLWLVLLEPLLPTFGKFGEFFAPWRPRAVFDAFCTQHSTIDLFGVIEDWAFGWAGFVYPVLWVVAIVALGIVVFTNRDVRP